MPIYSIKNETDGLPGGIVASYRSDEKRYDLSVFIAQAFDLYGDPIAGAAARTCP